jgi:zinc protease
MFDRKLAPEFTVPSQVKLLSPEKFTLDNGINVILINGGLQPVSRIEFVFPAGRWYEVLPGRSYFTAKMLSEGSLQFSSKQIASIFDRYGAHFEAHPGFDFVNLTLHCLSEKLPYILPVLFDVICNPTFREDELEKLKEIYTQTLAVNLEKNNYVASALVREKLFGRGHPYGRDLEIDEVSSISSSELREFFSQNYIGPQVFITGSIHKATLDLVYKSLSELDDTFAPRNIKNEIESSRENTTLEKSNSIQSSIKLATFCANRNDKDYFNLLLFNQILGGYFGSRLMKNIREDKGLTYGIHSGISALRQKAFFIISAEVNKDNKELVIQEIYLELDKLSKELVPLSEFNSSVNNFIGGLQSDLSTIFAHMDKVKSLHLNDLAENHYEVLVNHFYNSSPETLSQFAKSFVQSSFTEVIVG